MSRRVATPALLAALALSACGQAVNPSTADRARDAVRSFLLACSRGEWTAAAGIVTASVRESWIEDGDPALRCASAVGIDPERFEAANGADVDAMREAFASPRLGRAEVSGDVATVEVELGELSGEAELENDGLELLRIDTPPA